MFYIIISIFILALFIYVLTKIIKNNKNKVKNISFSCGMSYDLNDEKQIMKNIKNMSINEIAKFADIVAKTNSKNLTFLEGQFSADNIDQIMIDIENETSVNKMLNPTSIGNSAIIAIEAPEPYKSKAKLLFDMLISKV